MNSPDFIEAFENALEPALCDELITRFERHPAVAPGRSGEKVDVKIKDSLDLTITAQPQFQDLVPQLAESIFDGLVEYVRRHPLVVLASNALAFQDPTTGAVENVDLESFRALSDPQIRQLTRSLLRCGEINLQKYERGRGGYFAWHTEISAADPSGEKLHRVLPFMYYLNDVEEGGETEFYYYPQRNTRPAKGTLLLWPAYFTHTHRGAVPRSSDKYILTSWILFRRVASKPGPSA